MVEILFRCIMSCLWNAYSDLGVVLLNHSSTGDTRKMLVRICYSFPCVPCRCSTWTLGTKYWMQHQLSVPSHRRMIWGPVRALLVLCGSEQGHSPCALGAAACPDTSAPRAGAVFCWAWVTLAEMSAEPALALSAFTVSCKVNQMLLCDDKCSSWESSWRRLSIRPVPKWTTSRGVLWCWSSAVCGAPGSCAAPRGARAGCSGCLLELSLHPTGRGCCHSIEWNWFWPHLRVWHSELGEARSCALWEAGVPWSLFHNPVCVVFFCGCSGQELMGCFNLD